MKDRVITLEQAQSLFTSLNFNTADKWDEEKLNKKLAKLATIIDDKGQLDPDVIEDKKARKFFDEIAEVLKAGKSVTVGGAEAADKEESADEKPAKPAKKAAALEEDEEDEKPAKKSAKKAAPAADEDEAEEKPAKKAAAKKTTASSEGAGKDKHGFREGTAASKLAAAMTKEAQNHAQLVKAAGLSKETTYYDALSKVVKAGAAIRVDGEEGKAWKAGKK